MEHEREKERERERTLVLRKRNRERRLGSQSPGSTMPADRPSTTAGTEPGPRGSGNQGVGAEGWCELGRSRMCCEGPDVLPWGGTSFRGGQWT